jgi:hypothetical protein
LDRERIAECDKKEKVATYIYEEAELGRSTFLPAAKFFGWSGRKIVKLCRFS